jgi:hypothetical protein
LQQVSDDVKSISRYETATFHQELRGKLAVGAGNLSSVKKANFSDCQFGHL